MRVFAPADCGEKIEPGTAYSVLPISTAASAVLMVPDFTPASAISTHLESAAMMRFLLGKAHLLGPCPQGSSDMTAPSPAAARSNMSDELAGYTRSAPHPDTITQRPPDLAAARRAAQSQPMAPPDTTVRPHSAATRPAISATAMP